jgi:hypothetical protein
MGPRVATSLIIAATLVALAGLARASAPTAQWTPRAWADEDTLELRTEVPDEGEHWFPVWLVVIDDQVYVRLGTRAAERVQRSRTAPDVGLRVGGGEFAAVRGVPAPEMAGPVAEAMADKYWTDFLVRHFDHPLTLRLEPEPVPPAAP